MTQPLAGIRVLDFTTLLPGPMATLFLAEAGAEVTKLERPGGEDLRLFEPRFGKVAAAFALLNRGKASLIADLKNPTDFDRVKAKLQEADILVEQFRPGVMQRLGLGYADVRAINPRLIYCSISGYGQNGPRAHEAGHDLNYVGQTGLLALQSGPADRPVIPPALIADLGGGTFPAVINILLALRQRDRTGEGCHLDIAMTDSMFAIAWHAFAQGVATGRFFGSGESNLCGDYPRYQLYPTSDGRLVACGALEEHFWRAFTAAIGLPESLRDDRIDPPATRAAIARLIAARTADEWAPILAKADCCATIVRSLQEAMQDPHFVQRGLFEWKVEGADGATLPALPLPISPQFRENPQIRKSAPGLRD